MTHRLKIAAFLVRLRRKMIGEQLPIESIAGGWALGMFIGCAIPFGLQLVVSVPLSIISGSCQAAPPDDSRVATD